jgi:hypothetical protein
MISFRRFFFVSITAALLSVFCAAGTDQSKASPEDQASSFPVYLPIAFRHNHDILSEVVILSSSNHYLTTWGSLHVLGELQNNTGGTIYNVWVSARLYDRNQNLLRSDSNLIMLDYLAPGEQTCFDFVFDPPPANWSKYEFQPASYETGAPGPWLIFENTDGYRDTDSGGRAVYVVNGRIRNLSGGRVQAVKAVATLYNSNGKVLGCSSDYIHTSGLALNHNATGTFEVTFWDRPSYTDVRDFRLQPSSCPY